MTISRFIRQPNRLLKCYTISNHLTRSFSSFHSLFNNFNDEEFVKVKNSAILFRPHYDFESLKENQNLYIESSKRRGFDSKVEKNIIECKELYNQLKQLFKEKKLLQTKRNAIGARVKETTSKDARNIILKNAIDLKKNSKKIDEDIEILEFKIYSKMDTIPNLLDLNVEDEEKLIKYLNPAKEFEKTSIHTHKEIGLELGIMEFDIASKASGSSWYYLIGDGALLEQALVQYALEIARSKGFKMVIPPSIVNMEIMHACGFRPKDQNGEQQVYEIKNSDLCLTGTAEIPLAALNLNKSFDEKDLPLKYVGVSRSYRAEAGSRGKDTKGLYRVHEFTKVELFITTYGLESSVKLLEELRVLQEDIISGLGLTARVLNMPANDLGAPAYKKYDIEAWMPGRGSWGELTSSSNCTDYQSRRFNTKVRRRDDKFYFAHTLNGTAMAVPRVIAAILETFYDPETKSVSIPKVLQKYMDGKDKIIQSI